MGRGKTCGRPTKANGACGNPIGWMFDPFEMDPERSFRPAACSLHLTDADREEVAQHEARVEELRQSLIPKDPACWSWPVTQEDRTRAQEVEEHNARYALLEWQQDRCAMCGHVNHRLELDHDHQAGMVRGLLCRSCNITEGTAGGSLNERYRLCNPAVLLGLKARYWTPWHGFAEPRPDASTHRSPVHAVSKMLLGGAP